jgi:hypothetical protein
LAAFNKKKADSVGIGLFRRRVKKHITHLNYLDALTLGVALGPRLAGKPFIIYRRSITPKNSQNFHYFIKKQQFSGKNNPHLNKLLNFLSNFLLI